MATKKKPVNKSTKKIIITPEQKIELINYMSEGATIEAGSLMMGWGRHTLANKMKENPELQREVRGAIYRADHKVVHGLYKRATGYEIEEVRHMVVMDGKDNGSHIEQVEEVKHFPPETNAGKFWLTNRKHEEWKETQHVEVNTKDIPDDELLDRVKEIMKGASFEE